MLPSVHPICEERGEYALKTYAHHTSSRGLREREWRGHTLTRFAHNNPMKALYLSLLTVLMITPSAYAYDTSGLPSTRALVDNLCLASVGPQCVAFPKPIAGMGCSFSEPMAPLKHARAKNDTHTNNADVLFKTFEMALDGVVDGATLTGMVQGMKDDAATENLLDELIVE